MEKEVGAPAGAADACGGLLEAGADSFAADASDGAADAAQANSTSSSLSVTPNSKIR